MSLHLSADRQPSHDVAFRGYAETLAAVVEASVVDASTVYLWVDQREIATDVEAAPAVRYWWQRLDEHVVRSSARDDDERPDECYRLSLNDADSDGLGALFELLGTTSTGAGAWYLQRVVVARDDEPVVEAIPHHSTIQLFVAGTANESVREAISSALADRTGCVRPCEPSVAWTDADGYEWEIAGKMLCRSTSDGTGLACWELTRLDGVRVRDKGRSVDCYWRIGQSGGRFSSAVARAIDRLFAKHPETLEFDDSKLGRRVGDELQDFLDAYRPSATKQ
ncbi:hypothetical protein [Haloarchaeobius sp. DFWS5]|uniref:hypothetical protein n=1 Tax=Haloarchaeobius sp. DFWS5 TaxID=3446114 RepID=UPI003EBE8E01